jgi:hypothetical protein
MPSEHAGTEIEARLVGHAARFVEGNRLGVGFGAFTFRVGADGTPWLLEVHLDLAGDFVVDRLVPAATGLDVLAATLRHLAGRGAPPPRPPVTPAAVRFLFAGDLRAGREETRARLAALGSDVEPVLDVPATGEGEARRVGYVLLRADTPAALASRVAETDCALGRAGGT